MPSEMSTMPSVIWTLGSSRSTMLPENRDQQRRGAAHQRVRERQIAGAVRLRQREVVAEVDHRRRGDERPRRRSGKRDEGRRRSARTATSRRRPPRCRAARRRRSDDLSSAFQPACRKPAPSTASVTPSVSSRSRAWVPYAVAACASANRPCRRLASSSPPGSGAVTDSAIGASFRRVLASTPACSRIG